MHATAKNPPTIEKIAKSRKTPWVWRKEFIINGVVKDSIMIVE